jgi:hypothetical protein
VIDFLGAESEENEAHSDVNLEMNAMNVVFSSNRKDMVSKCNSICRETHPCALEISPPRKTNALKPSWGE